VRHNPHHFVDDPEVVRELIRENPWGILVSSPGTVGIRLPITRFHCKVKMSQDKDPETQRRGDPGTSRCGRLSQSPRRR